MQKISILFVSLSFLSALGVAHWQGAHVVAVARPNMAPQRTLAFTNGRWFDGEKFQNRLFYSSDGLLTSKKPPQVDEVIDLKNGYVIPPFGDAHNHYIAGPHDIKAILNQYLRDGIFYAKNPASIHRDTEQIKDLINHPESVDVIFANAGLTASGGQPVKLYDKILIKLKKPGSDGTFADLAYFIIDNKDDLERK